MDNIKLLQQRLSKVEKELSTYRTSVMQDGWQTSIHAKKARKWDMLAEEKRNLLAKIETANNAIEFGKWLDNLLPSKRCTVHSEHSIGLFDKTMEQLYSDFTKEKL